jgi:hypothetical protein
MGQGGQDKTPGTAGLSPELLTQMLNTLSREVEGTRDTLNRVLQDHAEERKRADTIIMQLRNDIQGLNDKLFLLTEGKKEEPGKEEAGADIQGKPPDTPGTPEDIRFTFGDRLWFLKEDIKRILHKKIF